MTLRGENGKDAEKAIKAGVEKYGRRVTREAATIWATAATERAMEAAGGRTDRDDTRDQRGSLEGRQNNNLDQIANAITAPVWDPQEEVWRFACAHPDAALHEWGAMPHEITAQKAGALAFSWPDVPADEETYEDADWFDPTLFPGNPENAVFYDNTEHPGVPAIGFMRYGREQAKKRLEAAGIDTEGFSERPDGGPGDG